MVDFTLAMGRFQFIVGLVFFSFADIFGCANVRLGGAATRTVSRWMSVVDLRPAFAQTRPFRVERGMASCVAV